jgi:hypothetical protein
MGEHCDCYTKPPKESKGKTLQRCPHCPSCGELGTYQGAGTTSQSNWQGHSFRVYYCSDCDERYKLLASSTPTID